MDETIAAISTPLGEGGIAIIRITGSRACAVADLLFESRRGKPSEFPSHTIHYGSIQQGGNRLDQVLLSVMRAPRTYTGEDTIEINCHGGTLTARRILAACFQAGARPAEPGEFTKRAFLNGRLDLTQAEAVMDVVQAKTERAQAAAARALEGHLSGRVNRIREQLVSVLAHIEAHIDFPEEDIQPAALADLRQQIAGITVELKHLLLTAREGRILRDGILIAIVGRPNVGKSSLMNALLGQERSIVTAVAGTTRDTIEEYANIAGLPVRLTDTAGIRKARGKVEELGVARSRRSAQEAELVIHVLDASRKFSTTDLDIAGHCDKKHLIRVLNKIDLGQRIHLPAHLQLPQPQPVSAKTGEGIQELKKTIANLAGLGEAAEPKTDITLNERHATAINHAVAGLEEAQSDMARQAGIEVVAQKLRFSLEKVGEVVGKTTTEDILTKIFGEFCIGK